jgi:hypothetical protein
MTVGSLLDVQPADFIQATVTFSGFSDEVVSPVVELEWVRH